MTDDCSKCREADNKFLDVLRSAQSRRDEEVEKAKQAAQLKYENKRDMALRQLSKSKEEHLQGRHAGK